MKPRLDLLAVAGFAFAGAVMLALLKGDVPALPAMADAIPAPPVEIHYSPEEDLEAIDVRLIDSAKATIDMDAYVLTDRTVVAALSAAARRGVRVRVWRETSEPAAARHFVEALRGLFEWLVDSGLLADDPTKGVKVVKVDGPGFEAWSEADEAAFRARWPLGTRERLAYAVLRETGLRRGDAVRVGRPHWRDGVIRLNTEKTGERVAIEASEALLEAIAAGPVGELTFIAGERGRPMMKESFGNWFREACSLAGVRKSAHGLRKAAATADAHAGWSDAELDAKYGWTGRRMASLYTRAASRERLSLAAAKRTKAAQAEPAPSVGEVGLEPTKA
jgi:integrase